MGKRKSMVRGILAGMAGGLAAAWVMNEFMAGPGQKTQQAHSSEPGEDATTSGSHLSRAQEEKSGPLVHYSFGALTGGLYGALAEYSSTVTSGFGTSFGGALFSSADLLAVPALNLATSPPFAARVVYGATTELVRRILRSLL